MCECEPQERTPHLGIHQSAHLLLAILVEDFRMFNLRHGEGFLRRIMVSQFVHHCAPIKLRISAARDVRRLGFLSHVSLSRILV